MPNRTRISTTVDTDRLARARREFDLNDAQLVDRALEALLGEVDDAKERAALLAQPYDEDEALAWSVGPGESLPYDGDVPDHVQRLASERRAQYRTE